ncbi:MAG: BON domain-containing protein [Trueperaceae bacterium]
MTENLSIDDRRRRSRGWIALGALLLGLLLFLCTCRDSREIQADLWAQGRAALEAKGYDPNILTMDGRNAILTGTVPTEAVKADAETVVRDIRGMRQVAVQNNLAVGDAPVVADTAPTPELAQGARSPSLQVATAAGSVTLSGLVSNASRPRILAAATELYGEGNVVDNLEVADDVVEPTWLSGALGLLPQVKNEVREGKLEASSEGITLEGKTTTEQTKTGLGVAAGSATGLTVDNKLQVSAAANVLTFALRLNEGKAELNGTVPEATIAPAVEAASTAVGAPNVVNNLQAAPDVTPPSWAPGLFGAIPALAAGTPNLGINVVDKAFTLTGTVPTPEARESVAKQVQDAVGPDVTIANQLQVADQTPTQLRVKLAPDAVQLSGTVAQGTADDALDVAGQVSPTGSVVNQMTVAENVAQPTWLPNLLGHLPDLSKEVQEGEVNVQGDTITLVGAVPSEADKVATEAKVREVVGADPTIANQLRVLETAAATTEPAPEQPANPVQLRVQVGEAGTSITGNVPAETATSVVETLGEATNSGEASNNVEPGDSVEVPSWLPAVVDALPQATQDVTDADVNIVADTITLAGMAPSEERKAEIEATIKGAAGPEVRVVNNLTVPAATEPAATEPVAVAPADEASAPTPAQRNPEVRIDITGDTVRLTGAVPSEASVAAGAEPYQGETVENLLEPSTDVADVAWLPKLYDIAPRVANDLNRATLVLSDTTVTIQGTAPSVAQRDAIGQYVSDALQPDVTVINRLTVQESTPSFTGEK